MQFEQEQVAIGRLADLIARAGASLFQSTKYIYSMCEKDFYRCDIKDVFRIILNNIYQVESLEALGLTAEGPPCGAMNGPAYARVFPLMVYSFAVRLPLLRETEPGGVGLTEPQAKAVYDRLVEKGALNHGDAVAQSFEELRTAVRKSREIPPYETEWYRAYLYQNIPELAQVSNRNIFLLGVADLLFTMFYLRLEEELRLELGRLAGWSKQGEH